MELNEVRLQQFIESIHSEGWYTQAEELQKLLDGYQHLRMALKDAADMRESDLDDGDDDYVKQWRQLLFPEIAWLIETKHGQPTLYYSTEGFCSIANHGDRFDTQEEAEAVCKTLVTPTHAKEHQWGCSVPQNSVESK